MGRGARRRVAMAWCPCRPLLLLPLVVGLVSAFVTSPLHPPHSCSSSLTARIAGLKRSLPKRGLEGTFGEASGGQSAALRGHQRHQNQHRLFHHQYQQQELQEQQQQQQQQGRRRRRDGCHFTSGRFSHALGSVASASSATRTVVEPAQPSFSSSFPASSRPPSVSAVAGAPSKLEARSLLSLSFDELSEVLEGSGRAAMVWAALEKGFDPLLGEGGVVGTAEEGTAGGGGEQGKGKGKGKGKGMVVKGGITDRTMAQLHDSFHGLSLPWSLVKETVSPCGTRKLLIKMEDGLEVETVLIPSLTESRTTLCVSSQVGCVQGCRFCMTGTMGLLRDLTAEEILAQVWYAKRAWRFAAQEAAEAAAAVGDSGGGGVGDIDTGRGAAATPMPMPMPELRNIVFMGMGEPLNNVHSVKHALRQLTHNKMFGFAPAHIAVSTVGPSPEAILEMRDMPARLAWSVHAGTDEVRKALVPTTRHSMVELRDAFSEVLKRGGGGGEGDAGAGAGGGEEATGRSASAGNLFVEATLIDGVNDTPELALAMAELLAPLPGKTKINLLPYNDIGVAGFKPSPAANVEAFQKVLREQGFTATVRVARGDEESSACGMLATASKKDKKREKQQQQQQQQQLVIQQQ